ncbi:MAG TPA: hypothetical protein VFH78_08215 [Candidatus Thermoplasmatota archaeon]|nr:hypothetical protein [Candidatus Thermoplasmatota archaeon]
MPLRPGASRLVALVLLVAFTTGCVELSPARIPDRLLEGPGGNGWEKNLTASQTGASGSAFSKSQALVYEDRRSSDGYPGTMTVSTLRTLFRPTEERVRDVVQERIREEAEGRGVRIEGTPTTGERRLANGEDAYWFVYNGTVQSSSGFFQSRNARVKIYGEVFQCDEEKTVVAVVGLAQITDVRSVGGVQLPSEADPTTWREIAADPRGTIEGIRGSDGLAYNVQC